MLKNYLKIAIRNLWKHKGYTAINVMGLAIGMAACLLILIFVQNERSYDAFHSKKDRLYRLNEIQSFPGISPQHVALSMYPMGPSMKADYPEVEEFVRFAGGPNVLQVDGVNRTVSASRRVDPSFFDMFDFPVLQGDRETLLQEPNTVVLTASTARALYGTTDVLGRQLTGGAQVHEVVGVLADVPQQSHLQFDVLFGFTPQVDERQMQNWGSNWLVTYLQLAPGADQKALEAKFPEFKARYLNEQSQNFYELYLQPLMDVHLGSMGVTHDYRNWQKFDRTYVYIFGMLAFFVLVIASINFMNLSTARSATRAKEVGVRKAIGAHRQHLTQQFLGESVVLAIGALVVAVAITVLALPALNNISQRDLSVLTLATPLYLSAIVGITLLVGVLSGVYPALVLSSFDAVHVLKGVALGRGRKSPFRNVLVVTQFAIAIALIVGTTFTLQQLNFMKNRDIGFTRDHVLLVPMSNMANENYELLKEELRRDPNILDATASSQRLGNNLHQTGVRIEGEEEGVSTSRVSVDANYLDFYGIEMLAGRSFEEDREADRAYSFVVNEAFASERNWDEAVGKRMGYGWRDSLGVVIGVAKDFNYNSLHHKVEPLIMSMEGFGFSELSVRLDASHLNEGIASVERIWNGIVTDRPFSYEFLDEHFSYLYQSDQQVSRVVGIIAGLAIIIACLGLFGLAAITTEQRTKEIGIRKALGATVGGLVLLLSRDFTQLIGVAFLIAAPVTYFVVADWLSGFAYRIDIGWGVFLFAGVLSLGIALLTVSYRAIRAARANPVKALRYE